MEGDAVSQSANLKIVSMDRSMPDNGRAIINLLQADFLNVKRKDASP